MLNKRNFITILVVGLVLVPFASVALGVEPVDKKSLKLERLAQLEESADSAADYERLARLYELRAEMLEEKVERHQHLTKRYAAAPASLLAKRGTAWNTPKRQQQLARVAQRQALEARDMAFDFLAKADALSVAVD